MLRIRDLALSNLFCANNASWEVNSNKLFLVGIWALSLKIAMFPATIFSMRSMASLGVFNLIFPLAEASNSCLDYGLNPSIEILSYIGFENPWVGVFLNKPWNLCGRKVFQGYFDDAKESRVKQRFKDQVSSFKIQE